MKPRQVRKIFPQTGWLANKKFIALTGYQEKTLANFVATSNFQSVLVTLKIFSGGAKKIKANQSEGHSAAAFYCRKNTFLCKPYVT